jgi:hypothetical protein
MQIGDLVLDEYDNIGIVTKVHGGYLVYVDIVSTPMFKNQPTQYRFSGWHDRSNVRRLK